ncbi:hypothetical protein V493_00476 [Pseudogymnoascus sp. VKM F-4281 (FW-2241)]|nr:hypothetical protein V493_00476 [Pseudogymnoascus sp. VKM F-4281 (FW-2241)]
MGGMGNQDGGDEDFQPQRRRNCEEEEREEAREKKRFMGAGGGMAKSLCATESKRDHGRRKQGEELGED